IHWSTHRVGHTDLRVESPVGDSTKARRTARVQGLALDCRAHIRLVRALQAPVEGLRATARDERKLDQNSDDEPHAPPPRSSLVASHSIRFARHLACWL